MRIKGRLSIGNRYDFAIAVARRSAEAATPVAAPSPVAEVEGAWYRIGNVKNDRVDIYLFDEIGGWGIYADEFVRELNQVDAKAIDLHVNSPGGNVFEGLTIMAAIHAHPAEVTAHVDGVAASAASFLIQAADRIMIGKQSKMMIHDASGLCIGNADDMLRMGDLLDKISADIADIYAQASGQSAASWRTRMRAETWYTGQQAVDAGLADECFTPQKKRDSAPPEDRLPQDVSPTEPDESGGNGDPELPAGDFSGLREAFAAGIERGGSTFSGLDREAFEAGLDHVLNNRPAPPEIKDDEGKGDTSIIDRSAFDRAMREALHA